jgi:hypothetical protein
MGRGEKNLTGLKTGIKPQITRIDTDDQKPSVPVGVIRVKKNSG